ncbi:FAD-binding oxidoreductase, partial [candidate division WWE3 bacterium]|nr:FAD-binding oxidoreductase [candidate division WWE3 bacterium]
MKKILKRIEDAIEGEVVTDSNYLDYYSTDGSIFEVKPTAVCFPKDTIDVQNIVKIIHEEAENGNYFPITPRGKGTDQGGGPLGTGLIVDFTKYMNHILEIGEDFVRVEPGVRYGHLQDELKKRGKYLPPYPASLEICSIGGAISNNSAGEKTVKYGATRDYIHSLKAVLSDGELIETEPMTGQQVGAKKRQKSLEGTVYKKLDALLKKNDKLIAEHEPKVTKNSTGYALWEINKYGLFDLAQLITGSQGTLALVTEAILVTMDAPEPEKVTLAVSHYDSLQMAGKAIHELHKLDPSALEIVDINLIQLVLKQNPDLLKGLLPKKLPAIVLLTEFDDHSAAAKQTKLAAAQKIFDKYSFSSVVKENPDDQARLWKLRRSAAAVMWTIPGTKKALPIIEDGVVPP